MNSRRDRTGEAAPVDTDAAGPPAQDSEQAPQDPTDLSKPSWAYVATKTFREFVKDECTDLAAALTYYAVLSLFPAIIALLSLLSVVGQGESTVAALLQILEQLGAGAATQALEPVLTELSQAPRAGLALILGLATALWSASNYVNAFGRAMNRVYEIREGRPIWKLRPVMLLLTLVAVVLVALIALSLVVSGPVAQAIGDVVGLGSVAVAVWNIAKWPVMLLVVVLVVALLYYITPNVKQPRFRWISVGALLAIIVWVIASALFGLYIATFANYSATYGSLAGLIILLLWLWLTNIALLLGAELDAELERGRQLQAGIAAEETVQLPPKDSTASDKAEAQRQKDIRKGRRLRQRHQREQRRRKRSDDRTE